MADLQYDQVQEVNITDEVQESFLSYAMSVIVQRALPDAKDGLKPVQRRIMYGMNDMGIYSNKPYKKCARITGEVMGKYHPHGDSSIYEALVRMAQTFSYRYPLVDGHGNFGSIDGDGAAAARYTEARMSKISMELLRDIKKDTVDFMDNYDGEEREPVVLPGRFPNMLINGTTGIAVGMATNIPSHNLAECVDAIIAVLDNPDITIPELMENYIQGPDFPTGAQIIGRSGIRSAFETGRGSIIIRSKSKIVDLDGNRKRIIVSEIPYMVNKATLVARMAELVRNKEIEGISGIRDETNHEDISIVIDLKKDVQADVILNQLYRLTPLQTSYGINMLALVNNSPRVLNLKEFIKVFIEHQTEVVERATRFDLKKAEDRAHILEGLLIALDHIDEIIHVIRNSHNDDVAMEQLMTKFNLSEIQARAIMDMQLRRLTGLQRLKLEEEYNRLREIIADLKDILANHSRVIDIIKTDLLDMKEKYGDDRRTEVIEAELDVEDEDLIPVEDVVMLMTSNGYIKRCTKDTYRSQSRGGKGVIGMKMNDEDEIVTKVMTMSTHDFLMCFTNFGKVYRIKGYKVPSVGRTGKGTPIQNLIDIDVKAGEKVCSLLRLEPNSEKKYLFFATKKGKVKRVAREEFDSIRQSGKIAISLNEDDELFDVKLTGGDDEVIIASSNGKAIRFNENDVRPMGRNAAGVSGINVETNEVVGLATSDEGEYILVITQKGYGKRTERSEYRLTGRGAKGVGTVNVTEKNGPLVTLRAVYGNEDLLIATMGGTVIRTPVEQIGIYGRTTMGVRLIKVDDDQVSTIAILEKEEVEEASSTPVVEEVENTTINAEENENSTVTEE